MLAGLDGGDAADLIDAALERVGLTEAGQQKVRGYSLGMRQRLGLAAAMLRRPRLLILDEPANGMDPAGIRDLRAALRHLARDGVTVVLSSHDMAQVEEICDSVTVLHHGRAVFAGSLDKMRADATDAVWRLRTSDDAAAVEADRHAHRAQGRRPRRRRAGGVRGAAAALTTMSCTSAATASPCAAWYWTSRPWRRFSSSSPATPRSRITRRRQGGLVTLATERWPAFAEPAAGRSARAR